MTRINLKFIALALLLGGACRRLAKKKRWWNITATL